MAGSGQWRRSLWQLLALLGVVMVLGLAAGLLFARTDASSAARLLLGEEVVAEPRSSDAPGPDADRPTSGPQRSPIRCGIVGTPPPPGTQVASLAAGVVILHHRPDLPPDERDILLDLAADHEQVLVAPARGLEGEVVGTAWRHRFEPDGFSETELERFVVGWSGRGPDPAPCP